MCLYVAEQRHFFFFLLRTLSRKSQVRTTLPVISSHVKARQKYDHIWPFAKFKRHLFWSGSVHLLSTVGVVFRHVPVLYHQGFLTWVSHVLSFFIFSFSNKRLSRCLLIFSVCVCCVCLFVMACHSALRSNCVALIDCGTGIFVSLPMPLCRGKVESLVHLVKAKRPSWMRETCASG